MKDIGEIDTRKQTVQSIERASSILDCFTLQQPELSLGELAQKTGLTKPTVYRILQTLIVCGLIQQQPSQKYSLGFKLFKLGTVVMGTMSLRDLASPFMNALSEETFETVTLNIIENDERVCIEVVESPAQIRNFVQMGQRNSLLLGTSGRVLLAFAESAARERIMDKGEAEGEIPEGRQACEAKLEEVRKQGYAIGLNDRLGGAFSIAAPFFDHKGVLAGCVTVAGPLQRLEESRIPDLVGKVKRTAAQISGALGFSG